jgi:hypothetical protein
MQIKQGHALNVSWALCWVAFIALAGCKSGGTIQATGSEDQAKQAVQQMLDAWKSGTQLSDFTTSHPELVVADEDWQSGGVLAGYKLMEPAALNGSHWRQKTELQLKGKGKSKPVVAIYAVTLGKKTVILRSDFQY